MPVKFQLASVTVDGPSSHVARANSMPLSKAFFFNSSTATPCSSLPTLANRAPLGQPEIHRQQVTAATFRILVQTKTHLVPGDDYGDRLQRMRNIICQHQWKRRLHLGGGPHPHSRLRLRLSQSAGPATSSSTTENALGRILQSSGTNGRERSCIVHFLAICEEAFLVLKLTPNCTSEPINKKLPSSIRRRLKRYRFEKQPPKPMPPPIPVRERVQIAMHCDTKLADNVLDHLSEHPKDVEWLRRHLESRFYDKIDACLKQHPKGNQKELVQVIRPAPPSDVRSPEQRWQDTRDAWEKDTISYLI